MRMGYRLHDDVLYGILQFLSMISRHSVVENIQIPKKLIVEKCVNETGEGKRVFNEK
jgi:hypothetical protein